MKRLLLCLTLAVLLVGFGVPAMGMYHFVYEPDDVGGWEALDADLRECEMFSATSAPRTYRFQSYAGTSPGIGTTYIGPEAAPPMEVTIYNRLHLFPWITAHFNETVLIWDVFLPGNYMSKAFVVSLAANCPVMIHFGAGTFDVPDRLLEGYTDGSISTMEWEVDEDIDNKWRDYSLLGKDDISGTPDDVIATKWWWEIGTVDDWDYSDEMTNTVPGKNTNASFPALGTPTGWVAAPDMNGQSCILEDSVCLHEGIYLTFYEDIHVEVCDSEGKYLDEFTITICPDP